MTEPLRTAENEEESLMQQSQTLSNTEHVVQRGPYHMYAREYPGEKPAIVLMHGFPDNLHLYDRLLPWLITSRRVVTFRARVLLPLSQYPTSVLPQQKGSVMSTSNASKPALIPATEWFSGGRRVPYDPERHRVLTAHDDMRTPHLMVFERVVGAPLMDAE